MPRATYLGELELTVLLALDRLDEDAYGMAVYDEIVTATSREISAPTIYVTLARLEDKSYARSRKGRAESARGGRAKKYYRITAAGRRAVAQSRAMLESLWQPKERPSG
jgi:DNA-binding PadR family transcriptional regulator